MARPPEIGPERNATGRGPAAAGRPGPRLAPSDEPAAALEKVGRWLGAQAMELRLEAGERRGDRLAAWRAGDSAAGRRRRRVVRGESDWLLEIVTSGRADTAAVVDQAALALELWREAKAVSEAAELRLAARSAELDRIQTLGRKAAEARTVPELFRSAVAVLERGLDCDLALGAILSEGVIEMSAFLARPFSSRDITIAARTAARFLGGSEPPELERVELDVYDPGRGEAAPLREENLALWPLLRFGRPVGCLVIAPADRLDGTRARLLASAVNQLSVHLDRLLTLREAERDRFRSIVDSMPQGVLVADERLGPLQCNPSALSMLAEIGLDPSVGLAEMLDTLGVAGLVERVKSARSRCAEAELRVADDRLWTATVFPLGASGGSVEGVVLVLTDVTESRRLQQRLAQSEKLNSLGQMISGVAHELNNPLASILGYAQLLRATAGNEKLAERLDLLRREAERCRRIVGNLLSFAKQRETEPRPVAVNQVVEGVLSLLDYQFRVDNIRVERELCAEVPLVSGDAHQLGQVLVNLLTNARQAMRRRERGGRVTVRTEPTAEGVAIVVRDNGPGIPEPLRSRIFDPFFTTKGPGEGTGLGLSLAHGIVAAHGGRLELLPAPAGATFRCTLPRGESSGGSQVAPGQGGPAALRSGRILVVEDEEALGRLICEVLDADGHVTERATDGQRALVRLAAREFDLIISDMKMPGMSGDRLHEELRRSRPELCRRLLLMTGDTMGREPEELAASEGLELLHKPFDVDELRRRVRVRLAAG